MAQPARIRGAVDAPDDTRSSEPLSLADALAAGDRAAISAAFSRMDAATPGLETFVDSVQQRAATAWLRLHAPAKDK